MSAGTSVDVQLEVEPEAVDLLPALPRLDEAANWYLRIEPSSAGPMVRRSRGERLGQLGSRLGTTSHPAARPA